LRDGRETIRWTLLAGQPAYTAIALILSVDFKDAVDKTMDENPTVNKKMTWSTPVEARILIVVCSEVRVASQAEAGRMRMST